MIEPLVSISIVRRSKSTDWPTRVSSTVKLTLRIGEKIESIGISPIMCSMLLLAVGRHVAARLLDADLHRSFASFFGQRRDVVVRVGGSRRRHRARCRRR